MLKYLFLSLAYITSAYSAEKPNIILLLSDDHSYPYLSCYGDTNVKTPHLDALAQSGLKMHRFFTTAPQCVPSRASLMTGRSPVAARITRFSSPLARDEITLPEILRRDAGYYTGVLGRHFHLDGNGMQKSKALQALYKRENLQTFHERVDYIQNCGDEKVLEATQKFIAAKPQGKPFFLWANFSDPHHVWNAPASLRPDPASLKLPAYFPDLPSMREQLADYCAEVNHLDEIVGKLLDYLTSQGLDKNTLIIFCGDNGAALPRGKGSLHDLGCNTPMLISWPGVVKGGTESSALISGEDVAPTMLAAAGLSSGEKMSGINFLPLFKGEKTTLRKHLFMERGPHGSVPFSLNVTNQAYDLARAVRSERYKLIYNCTPWVTYSPVDSAGDKAWLDITEAHKNHKLSAPLSNVYFTTPRPVYELYDLHTDPAELTNLSGKKELLPVEAELRIALAEKMVLDFDYLPLPELLEPAQPINPRAAQFTALDKNADGLLSLIEFTHQRDTPENHERFKQRDLDKSGALNRTEFLPNALPTK